MPAFKTTAGSWIELAESQTDGIRYLYRLLTSQVEAEVAILMDWENWWALELDSKPSSDLKLIPQIYAFYKQFFDRHITVDFVHPEADLARYKLVIAPNLYLVKDPAIENINRYVEQGGTLLMSFFSGITDENEHIWTGGYPTPFRKMLGLVVEEFVPGAENTVRFDTGEEFATDLWADVVHLEGAQALAV